MASAAGTRSGNRVGRVERERSGATANVIKMWNIEIEDGRETDGGTEREEKTEGGSLFIYFIRKSKKVSDSSTNREGLLFSAHVVRWLATSSHEADATGRAQ